jgi:hypothetical protein
MPRRLFSVRKEFWTSLFLSLLLALPFLLFHWIAYLIVAVIWMVVFFKPLAAKKGIVISTKKKKREF